MVKLSMYNYLLNKLLNDKLIVFLLICPFVLMSACRGEQAQENGKAFSTLRAFTGSPTRVVWVQDLLDNRDVVGEGNHLGLMGYDSEDGRGERFILPGPENFMRPLISPSGRQVVFSSFAEKTVQVVDWSGKNRKTLTNGLAVATWRDPGDGVEWIYIARSPLSKSKGPTFQHLYRVQLNNPATEELIWDKTVFSAAVQLSRDGRRFSSEIPWPDCAVIDLDKMEARRYGRGCWPALAPDNSYRFWFFDGAHRNLEMVDTRKGTRHRIPLTNAPGIEGNEVYHPRWSNHPRYMVMTGPYTIREGGNNIRGGGAGVEIYAGRFNDSYTAVEAWLQVSTNQRADFYPDMWVARDEKDYQELVADELASLPPSSLPEGGSWPIVNDTLLFAWENAAVSNEWRSVTGTLYQAEIAPEGMARFALNYQMDISNGWYEAKRLPEPDPHELSAVQAISLEFVFTFPGQGKRDDVRLLTLGKEKLTQTIVRLDKGTLVLERRHKGRDVQTVSLGQMPAGKSHVLLEVDPGQVSIRVNAEKKRSYPLQITEVVAWPLLIGDPGKMKIPGINILLERVALYGGKLKQNEITQTSQLFSQMEKTANTISPIVSRVELLSASTIPHPQDILPYRRGLVVNEYKIVEMLKGEIKDPVILVAHWAILNGEALPVPEQTVGHVYELRLDVFDNRPELEGERLSMDSDNLLLPMYYDLD
ncbi:MAG: hypothetical protein K9K37_04380 [Desulfocapsa sp.]|nr:hypothetical protein [Desulfocapsa sp.]